MNKHQIGHTILVTFFLFISCNYGDNSRYLGKISASEVGIFFKLYQEDKFESSVGIYFEITNNQNKTIFPKTFLIGTSDFDRRDTKDFFVSVYDSIVYIGFKSDTNVIYKMYDIKSKKICCEYPTDDSTFSNQLLGRLKVKNKNLRQY